MLAVFDALAETVPDSRGWKPDDAQFATVIGRMETAVAETADILPVLRQAGVIDAGALGLFIFLEAFFAHLSGNYEELRPVTDIFPGRLQIAAGWSAGSNHAETYPENGYCVNTLIKAGAGMGEVRSHLAQYGQSMVLQADDGCLKLHLHTQNSVALRSHVESLGQVLDWSEEAMDAAAPLNVKQGAAQAPVSSQSGQSTSLHIMTDAAGSITPADAAELGMTLLNSYLVVDDRAWPETLFDPAELYAAMARGQKVSTAQASLFERRQSYLSATRRFEKVLYLCVGSAFTGNCQAAVAWQDRHGCTDRFEVIDTGAASGRLGILALSVGRLASRCADAGRVIDFARAAVAQSREFVFLDQLKYLAAGGRISKTRGFFGDLLNMKPVISPTHQGAVKVAVVRNRKEQLSFALKRLEEGIDRQMASLVMLQYSNNRSWVEDTVAPKVRSLLPAAEIMLRPLSLTSGAHMGPGTWAVAFLPCFSNHTVM
jgi:DegV family protein with EDD domain